MAQFYLVDNDLINADMIVAAVYSPAQPAMADADGEPGPDGEPPWLEARPARLTLTYASPDGVDGDVRPSRQYLRGEQAERLWDALCRNAHAV